MSKRLQIEIDDRQMEVSNLDKVLYPETGFTKGQVIDYYTRISRFILPHLRDRPLTLKRYPGGVADDFFYEKQCPSHRPEWVSTATLPNTRSTKGRRQTQHCVVDSLPALVWVANLASLEMHVLLSRAGDVTAPTMVVFDLDPGPPADLVDCARVALLLRERFDGLSMKSFIKTSGGKGLHLYVPLNTPTSYEQTKPFARSIAAGIETDHPSEVTSNMRKELRTGKVFIDWSQNDQHKTTVCVYSLRARRRPTVSMPLTWDEVGHVAETGDASGVMFEADAALERIKRMGDLFAPLLKIRQKIPNWNAK